MKRLTLFLLLGTVSLLLAGCGGQAPEPPQEITVRMREYEFEPASLTLEAGRPVSLTLINEGTLEHEWLLGQDPGDGYAVDFFDRSGEGVEIISGEDYHEGSAEEIAEEGYHVEIEPGGQVTIQFDVPEEKAGQWEMGCFLDVEGVVHYEQGMHGPVNIGE